MSFGLVDFSLITKSARTRRSSASNLNCFLEHGDDVSDGLDGHGHLAHRFEHGNLVDVLEGASAFQQGTRCATYNV